MADRLAGFDEAFPVQLVRSGKALWCAWVDLYWTDWW